MSLQLSQIFCLLGACAALSACADKKNADTGKPPAVTVTTAAVAVKPWSDSIEALGTAQANESVMVTAKVTETVVRVNFEDGDLVEAGQVLVDLSGRAELAGLEEAAAGFREAEQQMRRQQQLTEQKLVPASQLDTQRAAVDSAKARLDATRARLSDRVITAPFAGVLGFRRVSPGTLVTPGTTIASLDDISVIKLEFSVPESFLAALAPGQKISARSSAYPGKDFFGVLRTISSRVDPITRSVGMRAEVPNPERELRAGMLLTVRIFQPERQALVVPEIAIVQIARDAFVYRVGADDAVQRVALRLGLRRAGEVEVIEGLAVGERIVIDGTGKLRPGARIRDVSAVAAASAAVAPPAAAPPAAAPAH